MSGGDKGNVTNGEAGVRQEDKGKGRVRRDISAPWWVLAPQIPGVTPLLWDPAWPLCASVVEPAAVFTLKAWEE